MNNATLSFNRTNTFTVANNIGGTGVVVQNGSGGVTNLSGNNTYTGTSTVTAGALVFNTTSSLYNGNSANWTDTNIVVNSGGILAVTLGGANGFSASQVQAISQLGTATGGLKAGSYFGIDTSNGDQTYANVITNTNTAGSNNIGFVKLGANTLTLTANNTYTNGSAGSTRVVAGTLQLGDGGSTGSMGGTSTVSISSGATLAINRNNAMSIGNTINGAGGVTQMGSGTTTLGGGNNYTGATNVNAGTLLINGNQSSATGAVTVANGASLGGNGTIGGAVTIQNGGRIFARNGSTAGTLNVANVTVLSGGALFAVVGASGNSGALAFAGNTLNLASGSKLALGNIAGFDNATTGAYTLGTFTNGNTLQLDGSASTDGQVFGTYVQGSGPSGPVAIDVSSVASLNAGDRLTLQRSGNNLVLVFSPVPEPASLLAVCGLVVGGVVGMRKLRRKGTPSDVTPAA